MTSPDPNSPWDRQWRVRKPDDYTPGLYRAHQLTAHHMLRSGCPLTKWEAHVCQIMAYQSRGLSSLQSYWLNRIERERFVEMAA